MGTDLQGTPVAMAGGVHTRRGELPLTARLSEVARGYQRTLAVNPRHPEALVGISLVALASGQTEAAIQMAGAAVAAAPTMETAWVALGQAWKVAGQNAKAEQAYREAIRLNGRTILARMGLGDLLLAAGEPESALREYGVALQRSPAMPALLVSMGHALACMGRNAEALESYEKALSVAPRAAEVEFACGFALVRLGRTEEAERRYRRALTLRPDFAAAWMNLGCLLREKGRAAQAEVALRRGLVLRPDMITGWLNLALLKGEQRLPDEALEHLRKAFALDPEKVETQIAWCQHCVAEEDLAGAGRWLRWALARDADNGEAANMRGILLHTEGRFAEAVVAFERAETLGNKSAASNRGNSLTDMGHMAEGLRAHEEAAKRDPQSAGARYNLALTQLRLGRWVHGWEAYEARWRFREVHRKPMIFRQPRWRGEALRGRTILLYAEQGLGDAIQFCRYAALVAARGGKVILQVHAPAERLMHSLEVVRRGEAQVARLGEEPPAFDLECPLMSLPAVFGTTVETVPWTEGSRGGYLDAELELVAARRREMEAAEVGGCRRLRIGVAWAGNPRYKADGRRSIQLATLLPLLRMANVSWISLQKGEAAEQLKQLPDDVALWDGSSRDQDLAETAALVQSLDLVIATDTCIPHLAGALGKPVWILLPHLADWRWMERVETTPWYPTARLFRQRTPGNWPELIRRVAVELSSTFQLN